MPHGDVQIDKWVDDGAHFADGCGGTFASLYPIPLTEEKLLKFGFTIRSAPSAYGCDCNKNCEEKKYILRGGWNGHKWFALEILNNGTHKEIKYVHQLQNLYYALTGEELKCSK